MRQVAAELWVGHRGDLGDPAWLHGTGIRAVVDLADGEPPVLVPRELAYLRFPLIDGGGNPTWRLAGAIAATARLVEAGVPTLVACSLGMSRSPSVAAAALAIAGGLDPDEALRLITQTGPSDVSPRLWAEVRAAVRATTAPD